MWLARGVQRSCPSERARRRVEEFCGCQGRAARDEHPSIW